MITSSSKIMDDLPTDVEYLGRISSDYASLSKSQKRIARYILTHREDVVHYSITQLAQKTNTAPSTITRFCQALSYKGFSELKVYLEKNIVSDQVLHEEVRKEDSLSVMMQKQLGLTRNIISDTQRVLSIDALSSAVDDIIKAKTIHLYGQSGGYISALYGQQLMLRVGVCSQAFNDNLDMNLAASTLRRGDVAICIAYSGEIKSVVEAITKASKNGATVIAITATPNSSMARISKHILQYSYDIPDGIQYLHIASMCEISILGAIQSEILRRTENANSLEEMKKTVRKNRIK